MNGIEDLGFASFVSQRHDWLDNDRIKRWYAVQTAHHVAQEAIVQGSVRAYQPVLPWAIAACADGADAA
jgi:hypothetical protein